MNLAPKNLDPPDFVRDHRGAVMVVGVFMAAFLVGSLWYIIGIGDAILYRERMQEGADAVAFGAAVYHARGMNMIAMINIIMAGILGVLVAFKLLQLINMIALAVSCALAAYNIGNPLTGSVCALTTALEVPIQNSVQVAERLVDATLPVLSKTQVGIAITMPWIAQARAVEIADNDYDKPVESGGFVSTSLVPYVPQERLGLPVQEDDYNFLCMKAAEGVGQLVFEPFGAFQGWVKGLTGGVVGMYPSYFCGSGSIDSSAVKGATDGVIKRECSEHCKNVPKRKRGKCRRNCIKDAQKDTQTSMNSSQSGSSSSSVDSSGKTSKKVFWGAENGNEYFQIWSVVVGDEEWPKRAEKGVQIAAWNKRINMPDAPWGKVHFAQAEFYYDESGDWNSMKEDAMWNMRWRARLRRVRPPSLSVGGLLSSSVGGMLSGKVSSGVVGALGSTELGSFVTGDEEMSEFEDKFKSLIEGGSAWSGAYIEDPMLRDESGVTVIH